MKKYLLVDRKEFEFEGKKYYLSLILCKNDDNDGYHVKHRRKKDGSKSDYQLISKDFFDSLTSIPVDFSSFELDLGGKIIRGIR